jgi:hypothetical protein
MVALASHTVLAEGEVAPGAMAPDAAAFERRFQEHEIHRGNQLRWMGVGLGVLGIGLGVGSVPVWQAALGCTSCQSYAKVVVVMGPLAMDGFALAAIGGGVAAWVIGTSRVERARATIVPVVVPMRGGAFTGAVVAF